MQENAIAFSLRYFVVKQCLSPQIALFSFYCLIKYPVKFSLKWMSLTKLKTGSFHQLLHCSQGFSVSFTLIAEFCCIRFPFHRRETLILAFEKIRSHTWNSWKSIKMSENILKWNNLSWNFWNFGKLGKIQIIII